MCFLIIFWSNFGISYSSPILPFLCCKFSARVGSIVFFLPHWLWKVIRLHFTWQWFRVKYLYENLSVNPTYWIFQKQPPRGVLKKRCSENIQQIYRRTPMPKCDFNKVAKQHLFLGTPLDGCFWDSQDKIMKIFFLSDVYIILRVKRKTPRLACAR